MSARTESNKEVKVLCSPRRQSSNWPLGHFGTPGQRASCRVGLTGGNISRIGAAVLSKALQFLRVRDSSNVIVLVMPVLLIPRYVEFRVCVVLFFSESWCS